MIGVSEHHSRSCPLGPGTLHIDTPPGGARTDRCATAFTLLEVLVVVSIIAIASAVAVPRLSGSIARARVTTAGQRIVADMERARSRAIAQSRGVTMTFSRQRYQITGDQRPVNRAMPSLVSLVDGPYYSQIETVDFNGTDSIAFDMFGNPSSGGAITLSSGSQAIVIKVDQASGIGVIR